MDNAPARAVSYAEMDGDEATRCAAVLRAIESGELDDVTSLDVSNCGLEELPESVGRLRRLEFLNAGGNRLRSLPASVKLLTNLKRAFFLANAFEEVPEVLGELPSLFMLSFKANAVRTVSERSLAPSLGWLILSDNAIERLPNSLGNCARMRKLMLAGNRLSSLPESMKNLKNLELLRLADNRFETIPEWLLELPRLSWFAAAANPATDPIADAAKTRADHAGYSPRVGPISASATVPRRSARERLARCTRVSGAMSASLSRCTTTPRRRAMDVPRTK